MLISLNKGKNMMIQDSMPRLALNDVGVKQKAHILMAINRWFISYDVPTYTLSQMLNLIAKAYGFKSYASFTTKYADNSELPLINKTALVGVSKIEKIWFAAVVDFLNANYDLEIVKPIIYREVTPLFDIAIKRHIEYIDCYEDILKSYMMINFIGTMAFTDQETKKIQGHKREHLSALDYLIGLFTEKSVLKQLIDLSIFMVDATNIHDSKTNEINFVTLLILNKEGKEFVPYKQGDNDFSQKFKLLDSEVNPFKVSNYHHQVENVYSELLDRKLRTAILTNIYEGESDIYTIPNVKNKGVKSTYGMVVIRDAICVDGKTLQGEPVTTKFKYRLKLFMTVKGFRVEIENNPTTDKALIDLDDKARVMHHQETIIKGETYFQDIVNTLMDKQKSEVAKLLEANQYALEALWLSSGGQMSVYYE